MKTDAHYVQLNNQKVNKLGKTCQQKTIKFVCSSWQLEQTFLNLMLKAAVSLKCDVIYDRSSVTDFQEEY